VPGGESLAGKAPAAGGVRLIAEEQAALRRVAVLVAQGEPPEEVFAAVAAEAGQVLHAQHAFIGRYDPDGTLTVVAASSSAAAVLIPVGTRFSTGGRNLITLVLQTGRPARFDDYASATGETGTLVRESGIRATVGVPVSVEGLLWGLMAVASREEPLPPGTEARLAAFTELAATAIANAQAREELRGFAAEQAAMRRVAVLVARGAPPEEVFAAVAGEAARVLGAAVTTLARYDPDGAETVVGAWTGTPAAVPVPVGTRKALGGRNVSTLVSETGRPARIDDYADFSGEVGKTAHETGSQASVGVPVSVEGRLWGVMIVASPRGPLPAGAEGRLAAFTELAETAIANAQARVELRSFADEQAALRRVAVLVARSAPPQEVFTAVSDEAGRLLKVDHTVLSRYDADGLATIVGHWASTESGRPLATGLRLKPEGRNITALVLETGRSARIDDYGTASGAFADFARDWEFRASVGVPIRVEGRLWGIMGVGSRIGPLPTGTEARLAGFTELAATAIANAEAQAALAASRVRIVAAADAARRRIERDLHDGAQQRLVSLALYLREAQAATPPATVELAGRLEGAVAEVNGVLEELREIARGVHPAVLTKSGLRSALRALARRSAVPVSLDLQVTGRLAEPVEIAAYYTVAEALTNIAKHARASTVEVEVAADERVLRVCVRDDGRGGADPGRGSGLAGLKDRVEALGGQIFLDSPRGAGTTLRVELPCHAMDGSVTIADVPEHT
jgi:GAF domain-containing protein